jgi:hypothetical protein
VKGQNNVRFTEELAQQDLTILLTDLVLGFTILDAAKAPAGYSASGYLCL